MEFTRRTAELLHEEHRETIAMIEGLEDVIARAKRATPDPGDPQLRRTLEKAIETVGNEVRSHFAFEENELFTRLAEFGDEAIGNHLREEHRAMLPIAEMVAELASDGLDNGFTESNWSEFRSLAGELTERMLAHIQKEEMALLPMLEELLDPETDMQLFEIYTNQ